MKDWTTIRERYLRNNLPIRLGGLAANLARIKSFSDHPGHYDVVESLLNESKYFIEWTALDTKLEIQTELVELQLQLACWQLNWKRIWNDPVERNTVSEKARLWSERILEMSGLLR
ncbi:MAG: hypothetical protein HXY44_16770 [Syntrophaceae bacterium]|nr:hypothetical protein [Syntrophaceae bacterium]